MKFLIALACLIALAYAAEEAKPADNSADLAVDENRWGGYYGGHGYGHYYRPHHYGQHYRGRRSVEVAAPAEESDQSVDEHRYHGWGGHYRGWGGYSPYYGGYYGRYRGRRSIEDVDQSADEHYYRGYGGYYRPHHYYGGHRGGYYWG